MSAPTATPTLSIQSFFSTTLSSSIVAGDTVIPMNAVPNGTEGFLVIDQDNASKEIIYYNSKGASSVTCPSAAAGRAQGGTTAVSHSSGATVKMNFVDQYWSELQNGHALSNTALSPVKTANPYKFSVYRSAALSTGASFFSTACDTKEYDTSSNVDIVTNVGRFTATVAGFYSFKGAVGYTPDSGGHHMATLRKNGAEAKRGEEGGGGDNANHSYVVVADMQLAIGDYVELWGYSAANISAGVGVALTYFQGSLASAT